MQVDCNWAGSITIRVLEYLTVNASYLKLILFNVAGPATIRAVTVKTTGTGVSCCCPASALAVTPRRARLMDRATCAVHCPALGITGEGMQ